MESLRERVRKELSSYQQQLADKLEGLIRQGLISHHEYERIVIDAKATGKAIIDGLDTNPNIPEDLVESYVYSLFDRYKREVEDKIRQVKQKSERQAQIQSLLRNITKFDLKQLVVFPATVKPSNKKKVCK
jgi:hypothetical protein